MLKCEFCQATKDLDVEHSLEHVSRGHSIVDGWTIVVNVGLADALDGAGDVVVPEHLFLNEDGSPDPFIFARCPSHRMHGRNFLQQQPRQSQRWHDHVAKHFPEQHEPA